MGGRAKMIPSFGTEVMLVPLIDNESTGERRRMFQDE